jgi:adenylate cyclase class 2
MEKEIEVKFLIKEPALLEKQLAANGAILKSPRVFESNLRFDTPNGELTQQHRVLRLRQDTKTSVTYKGPTLVEKGVAVRQEIEFEASNFTAAQHLFEALGYQISVMYEKYRTTYLCQNLIVVIDEMPYGDFVEIEGEDPETIRALAERLGLNWERRCTESYIALFNRLQENGLQARHLVFSEIPRSIDLGLLPADTN